MLLSDRTEAGDLLRSVIHYFPDPMWISDANGLIVEINNGLKNLFQVEEEELVGRYNILEDNVVAEQGHLPEVRSVYEEGKEVDFIIDYDSGLVRNAEVQNKVFRVLHSFIRPVKNEHGEVIHAICQHRDITEQVLADRQLRLNERKYKALFMQAGDAAFVMKRDRFIDCNERAEKLFRLSRLEMIEKHPWEVSPEFQPDGSRSREKAELLMDRVLEGETQHFEWMHITGTGEPLDVEVTLSIVDQEQEIFHAVLRDISKRKKAEKDLKDALEQLKEAMAMKDKVFAIIGHDLRTPFGAIMGISELALQSFREMDESQVRSYLEIIHDTSHQTFNLLNNLLEWSKVQTGHIQLRPQYFDLNRLVREVVNLFSSSFEKKGQELLIRVPEGFEMVADPQMVQTILRNLLSNAIKYTPAEGRITIDARLAGPHVEISVTDTGTGMSKEETGRLFREGMNESKSGTDMEKGTGLGLLLCHEFATLQNGEISVSSRPGEGSTFMIRLPAAV